MKYRTLIDGQEYGALNLGGSAWMVRRYKTPGASDGDNSAWDEALLSGPAEDPDAVIRAAIARGSWA